MNSIGELIHILGYILVVVFFILVILLLTNRMLYEISNSRKKQIRSKVGAFMAPLIFSDLNREAFALEIDTFKKEIPFEKNWCKLLILNSLINLRQNLKGNITQNIHFIYEQFGLFEVSLKFLNRKPWYIKSIGIYQFEALEYEKGEPYIRPYLNSKNKILSSNAYIALMSLTSGRLDFLIDYTNPITLTSEIKIMNILHSKKPAMPQNLRQWLHSGNPSVIRMGLKFMVYYNYMEAEKEILDLLQSNNSSIRYEVILTTKDLYIDRAEDILIDCFEKEDKNNKIAVLKTLGTIGTEASIVFLSDLIANTTSNDIRLIAVNALYKIDPDFFETHYKNDDTIIRMLNHVKDPYL